MGGLQTRTADSEYNEYNRILSNQFLHGLGEGMIDEILREISALENIDDAVSE